MSKRFDSLLLAIGLAALALALLFLALPAHAQDTIPALPAIPTTPAEVIAAFTFFGGSALVTLLVSLEKLFVPESVSAETLKQWTAVVVTLVFLVLVYSGNVSWFEKGQDIITKILPYATGIIGVLFGSSAFHRLSVKAGIPVTSYKRG